MTRNQNSKKGQVLLPMGLTLVVLIGMAGLAADAVIGTIIRANLAAAVDSALLAAARAPEEEMDAVADYVFKSNFPDGFLMTTSSSHSPLSYNSARNSITMTGTAQVPTLFMRVLGTSDLTVASLAEVLRPAPAGAPGDPPALIVIDEDTIDSDVPSIEALCGEDNSDKCINDDMADTGVRTPLFSRPDDIAPFSGLVLPAGEIGDEGMFYFANDDPQVSNQNGAEFTIADFLNVSGAAANENNLDKVADVFPLRGAEIDALIGRTVCAIVYDSDISVDFDKHEVNLKGATLGLTAFKVTGLSGSSGGSYSLPNIVVDLLDPGLVSATCAAAAPLKPGSSDPSLDSVPVLVR